MGYGRQLYYARANIANERSPCAKSLGRLACLQVVSGGEEAPAGRGEAPSKSGGVVFMGVRK